MAQAQDVTIPVPLQSGATDHPDAPQSGAVAPPPLPAGFAMSKAPKQQASTPPPLPAGYTMSGAPKLQQPAANTTPAPPLSNFARGEANVDSALDAAGRFGTRLGQSLGVPTNKEELAAAGTPPSLLEAAVGPGPAGVAKQLWQSGKSLYQGAKESGKEAYEAGQNIASGGPILQNVAKPVSTAVNAAVGAVPFIGAPMVRAGEDVVAKNYAGAAGGLTGVLGQVALEGAGERRLGTDEMTFHDAKVKEAQVALKEAQKGAVPYQASIDAGKRLPKEVQKPIDKAQAALDEAKQHHEIAKQAIAQRKVPPAAPEPTTAQVTAQPQAPRPAPTMRIPGTPEAPVAPMNVKTPGQVQPETFPQTPTETYGHAGDENSRWQPRNCRYAAYVNRRYARSGTR